MATQDVSVALRSSLAAVGAELDEDTFDYMSSICGALVEEGEDQTEEWVSALESQLEEWIAEPDIEKVCQSLVAQLCCGVEKLAVGNNPEEKTFEQEQKEDPSMLVHEVDFSLGFMGQDALLLKASLLLRKGRRYGVVGGNGVGKTTMLRKIATKSLPTFPQDLRVVFVEHEISGDLVTLTTAAFMEAAAKKQGSTKDVRPILTRMGFNKSMQDRQVQELSGGWRMRLALAQAMLSEADILCLDEPTNHLDHMAVGWLQGFLAAMGDVCVVVISHEATFLDAVATDILLMRDQQLHCYEGTFTSFTKQTGFSAADLFRSQDGDAAVDINFPEPERLANTACTKSVLNLTNVDFAYPTSSETILSNVNAKLMMISRCAVVGNNGSGKSTLVKLIVGELQPSNPGIGKMTQNHDLRVGYVSQHSMFHLEEHLQTSAVYYLQWRFKDGKDRESSVHQKTREIDKTREKKEVSRNAFGHVNEFQFKGVVFRRMKKGGLEYEVTFTGKAPKHNKWETLVELQKRGPYAMQCAAELDEEMRQTASGQQQDMVMPEQALEHLRQFGVTEALAKTRLVNLSGGQKARVVLAAAMWSSPHILVLDEPTNFLDEVSLRAVAQAVKAFKGGVIMVSHHEDFITSLCSEVWRVADGKVVVEERKYEVKEAAYNVEA